MSATSGSVDRIDLVYGNMSTVVTNSKSERTVYRYMVVNGINELTDVVGDSCGECTGPGIGFEYDADDNLSLMTDKNANKTVYSEYDTSRNPGLIAEKDAQDNTLRITRYTYHLATNTYESMQRTSVLPFGNHTTSGTSYDYRADNLIEKVHAYGNSEDIDGVKHFFNYSTLYRYSVHGQVRESVDTRGNTTVFGYYSTVWGDPEHGRLHTVTNALGHTVTYEDYASGKAGTVIDANGVQTTNAYDARGRLKAVTVHQRTTEYLYDQFGNMTAMQLPMGNRIGYRYDAANKLEYINDARGNYVHYIYDTEGNRTREEIKDASGELLKYRNMAYDSDNRLRSTDAFGSYTSYNEYDPVGNLTGYTDPNRNTTMYHYDPLNRVKAVIQPEPETGLGSISTSYTYDINDNVTTVTDGNGNSTSYVYDDMSRLVETVSPDTGTTRYEYDAAGNMVKKKDAAGTLVSYSYDALNRLTFIDYPGTDEDVTYVYDEEASGYYNVGHMTTMTDASGTTSYYYDEYGELVKEVKTFTGLAGSFTTEYTYDDDGNVETMTYPDGRVVTYTRNPVTGELESVTTVKDGTSKTLASNVTYLPFGPVLSYTDGNGFTVQRAYDLDYRLTYLKSGPMLRRKYGYDNNGNVTSIADLVHPEKDQGFTYDTLNRLTHAEGAYGVIDYGYDAVGNMTTKTVDGIATALDYVPGTNRLDAPYEYDDNGNMTGDGALDYIYETTGGLADVNPNMPMEPNVYAYAHKNPVNFTDPSGLSVGVDTLGRLGTVVVGGGALFIPIPGARVIGVGLILGALTTIPGDTCKHDGFCYIRVFWV